MRENFPFLIYRSADEDVSVHAVIKDETIWLTQKAMAELFDVDKSTISRHLKNIFQEGELQEDVVVAKIATTTRHGAIAGKTQTKDSQFYNLDAIISVGYRINSRRATHFRIWAASVLKEYMIKGFALDDDRLKQGKTAFGTDYFRELLERVRSIRASERRIWQQITDIYKVRELFDSMLKGYPIGYIMLWESPSDYESKKSVIGQNAKTYEEPKELVIDGQQRLTALVAAMFAVKVKNKNFADREIKISYNPLTRVFAVWSQAYERDPEWISRISDVFLAKEDNSISSLRRRFIKEANEGRGKKGLPLLTDEEEDRIEDNINALLNLSDYSLPTLEISYTADEEDVADIFVRVNSGGQSLTENNFIQTLI